MAEGRRSLDLEKEVKLLKDHMAETVTQTVFTKQMANIDQTLQSLTSMVAQIPVLQSQIQQNSGGSQSTQSQQQPLLGGNGASTSHPQNLGGGTTSGILPRTTKINFPIFGGGDPSGWIYKADQYFSLNQVHATDKVQIASFHLDNEPLQWFRWYQTTSGTPNWEHFCQLLSTRFGPSTYADFTGDLTKLKQTQSVAEYQAEFERLANHTTGLPESFYVSCFLSGLKEEIQAEVKMLRPRTMQEATGLARLAADKVSVLQRRPRPFFRNFNGPRATDAQERRAPFKPWRVKRLSPAEAQERRDKGLCYNCDEKFTPTHKCTEQRLYVIDVDLQGTSDHEEWMELPEEEAQVHDVVDDGSPPEISLQALAGFQTPQTMKLRAYFKRQPVVVLIDSGSTHNFIDPRIAKAADCYIYPCNNFEVMIANGGKLACKGKCRHVMLNMGDYSMKSDMYALPLGGCDIVLGVQWLRTLGPILWDFSAMWMEFTINDQRVRLDGLQAGPSQVVSSHRMEKLLKKKGSHGIVAQLSSLTGCTTSVPELSTDLQEVLDHHASVFEEPKELPPARPHDHAIQLFPGSQPPNIRPYRYPHHQKTEIEKLVNEMLEAGIIQHSTSPYSSPVILVRKKDGSWRMCIDFRALNKITVKDKFPIPVIEELLDELHGARFFSKLDLRSGYHQIRLRPEDVPKTAFRTHEGHYEFLVMPFGLTNAPSTFQSLMNHVLRPFLRKFVLVFFDDILIYSSSWDAHLQHLATILQLLQANKLYAKRSKCTFGQTEVEYLGHIVSFEGVRVDPTKIDAMMQWPVPTTLRSLRGFLGLTGYYRRFVRGYGKIAAPLTALLKKNAFSWTESAENAFVQLKHAMCTTPVLATPDFTKPFVLETDASDTGIGAVLMQEGHPLAFISRALSGRNLGRSTYEKEMLAILYAVTHWRPYLIGRHFIIKTDHQSLKYLLEQRVSTLEQQKWVAKLLGYDYEITYKKGKDNVAADALSRQKEDLASLQAISLPVSNWLSELQGEWSHDDHTQALIQKLVISPHSVPHFSWENNQLHYKGRLFLPRESTFKQKVLNELHSSPTAGHSGFLKTYRRVRQNFYWPGMKKDIHTFVAECDTCQRFKGETVASPGLLQPLPIPTHPWVDISMDFIEGLPKSAGKSVIMVVVDRLSKYAHFLALSHPYKAPQVAQLFLDNIFKLHGMPASIVSDRDPTFTSRFWQEFFKLQGTTLKMSSAYHPQTDGQTEVVNKCLETYLRCFVADRPSHWARWLPLAEWWYNTTFHTATHMTPYEAVYGQPPPTISSYLPGTSKVQSVDSTLGDHDRILRTLKDHLQTAQHRMKQQADQHRSEREFQVGDMVFLRLQPYRQTSLKLQHRQKLAPKFYGPYQVIQRIGTTAYKLDLPPSSKVHPVFHVSCLKKVLGSTVTAQTQLPEFQEDGSLVVVPDLILDRRVRHLRHRTLTEVLVQWKGFPPEDATWESLYQLQQDYPHFKL